MKKNRAGRLTLLSAALFAVLIIWLVVSADNADEAAQKNRADSVYRSVMNSASLCYSIEGEYPPSIEYLEENYGVKVDRDKYIVHYEYFGANVRPTVTVSEKGK
ncbi:MAG: hypothetical protein K2H23_08935 [Oscillospiraceae bacterium]|nr:hypothetical protein [Oscillospiraceae bacterium]